MTHDYGFYVGLAAAVPLSVIGNLLTPRVQQTWSHTNDARFFRRKRKLEEEYKFIRNFNSNRDLLTQYIVLKLSNVMLLFFAALFMPMAILYMLIPSTGSMVITSIPEIAKVVYFLIDITFVTIAMNVLNDLIRIWGCVVGFEEYEKSVISVVGPIDTEKKL